MDEIQQTLNAIKDGDTNAFGKLYDEYLRMVASVVRKVGRCPSSEIDFHVNEVFFRVYKGVFSFQGKSKFSTYVYRIALNYCFQLSKKQKKEAERSAPLEDHDGSVYFENQTVDAVMMEGVLDELPVTLRSAVVLYYYDQLPVKEIAKALDISENAVKNRLFQARDKIRKILKETQNA